MLRNVFFVLVLTALAATAATASPVHSGKTHGRASKSHATRARRVSESHLRHSAHLHRGYGHVKATDPDARRLREVHHRIETSSPEVHARLRPVSLRGRALRLPVSPLKGSLESLTRQNELTEADGLERILDETDLANRIQEKLLVPVPSSPDLEVSTALPENHRYCRPWTAQFLTNLARAHSEIFPRPLYVSSAVRTVEYQKRLMRRNHNAAAAEGDIVSPHLTGATIDIAKKGMSRQELKWMRDWLLPLQNEGRIDVEEEFRQACFHITVYKAYAPEPASPVASPEPGQGGSEVPTTLPSR